jgi:hypothetical protein
MQHFLLRFFTGLEFELALRCRPFCNEPLVSDAGYIIKLADYQNVCRSFMFVITDHDQGFFLCNFVR